MSVRPLPNPALNRLRRIGDPELDGAGVTSDDLSTFVKDVETVGLHRVGPQLAALLNTYPTLDKAVHDLKVTRDPDRLRDAQALFGRYGSEISGALLLAALPQSYATELGARTLIDSAGLHGDLTRRIRHTAMFLMYVMQPPEPPRAGQPEDEPIHALWKPAADPDVSGAVPWRICAALRLYHHGVRQRIGAPVEQENANSTRTPRGVALNQEDLLGMLLTFTITVFEVLERYGIYWTADEQDAYLHVWDVIGDHLGIGTPRVKEDAGLLRRTRDWPGLRPPTVSDSRRLLDQIRDRHWIDPGPTSASDDGPAGGQRAGRLLTSALLDELASAMPPSMKLLPITVMRALAPDVVRRRLSLGHNGIVIRALGQLPKRRNVVGRFTALSTPNPLYGRALRFMANEVTGRASVHFLRETDFFIPGLENWSRGFRGFS